MKDFELNGRQQAFPELRAALTFGVNIIFIYYSHSLLSDISSQNFGEETL
jgi:hypothetical protein